MGIARSVGACSLFGTLLKLRFCAPGVPAFCCFCNMIGLCRSSSIARSNPRISLRGCDPALPPESEFEDESVARIQLLKGYANVFCSTSYLAPQRTQKVETIGFHLLRRIQDRRESVASTHAQARPSRVNWASVARAKLVRPEHSGPVISLIAPTASPPFRALSISGNPCGLQNSDCSRQGERRGYSRGEISFNLFSEERSIWHWQSPGVFAFCSL